LTSSSQLSGSSRNLDVLRAIAVLCVYVAHLDRWAFDVQLGYAGVFLFFVHTSLVLMMSLDRTAGQHRFFEFYVRRAFRIYPLSLACIVLVICARIPQSPPAAYAWPGWWNVLANAGLIQNVTHSASVTGPLWSLPWEVQMYIVLPALYLLLQRRSALRVILGTWFLIVLARYLAYTLPVFRPLAVLEFAPYFLAGVVAFQLSRHVSPRLWPSAWPLIILALIAARTALIRGDIVSSPANDAVNYGMCLLLGLLAPLFMDARASWLSAIAHVIAKYSYGIYLFHVPIMWLAFERMNAAPVALRWLVLAVLTVFVPWLAYVLIERPLIEVGKKIASRHSRRAATEAPRPAMVLNPVLVSQLESGGVS
jgi:peptidoglycan/LPS O-acetylase OafA/YrhL